MTMQTQGELFRDQGIEAAITHAEKVHEDWGDIAFLFLEKFIKTNSEFLAEDIRIASVDVVPDPPSKRAWGSVIVRASKLGLITKIGYRKVKNPKAHCTPATLWKKV